MGRAPCCDTSGLKKGPWTPEEDQKLIDYIQKNGYGNWRTLPKNAGLQRCGKSCRLRWTNYLRPDIKRGRFSYEEEETIIQLHSILGNKWSAIAARLPGRTDNEIKNYWNTHIRKKLLRMGIDPVTHIPRFDLLDLTSSFLTTSNMYLNNQSKARLMGMHQSSSSASIQSMMSQSQINNEVGDHYCGQILFDQQDHQQLLDQSLLQLQALQQQMEAYVPIMESNSLTHDPFTGLYYGSDSGQSMQHVVDLVNGAEQSSPAIFPSQNWILSTPSSSPTRFHYSNTNVNINSSCTSTEDERDKYSNNNNGADYSSGLMKFEIPEGLDDVNELIY